MINLSYTLPKQEDQGNHDGETVEYTEKHVYEDTTPQEVSRIIQQLQAQGFDVTVSFKLKQPK